MALNQQKKKVTVLWLLTGYEGYGLATYLMQVGKLLAKIPDLRLVVITVSEGENIRKFQDMGISADCLGLPRIQRLKNLKGRRTILHILLEGFRQVKVLFAVAASLLKYRPDIIHTHTAHYHISTGILGIIFRKKVIWHWHGCYSYTGFTNVILKFLVNKADLQICISQFVKRTLPKRLHQRSRVIYNGIELPELSKQNREMFRDRFQLPENCFLVASVGRILPLKGFRYFVKAVPDILEKKPNTYFAIIGGTVSEESEKELGYLKSLITRLRLNKQVMLMGDVPHVSKYMSDFDVIVAPNLPEPGEGFGLAVVEAMSAGVSPVVTRTGAFPEIVEDGISGLIVSPQSAKDIAKAVVKLLSNGEYRKKLGAAAKYRVEKFFKIDRVANDIFNIYQEI